MELTEITKQINTIENKIAELELKFGGYPTKSQDDILFHLNEKLYELKQKRIVLLSSKPTYTDEEIDLYLWAITSQNHEWIITIHNEQEPVGTIGIDYTRNFSNINYIIKEQYRGNKYASKALKLLKNEMLKNGLSKPNIYIEPTNYASITTALSIGGQLVSESEAMNIYEVNLIVAPIKK